MFAVRLRSSIIARLSPATKLVFKILEQNTWMTQKQITTQTFLPPRTVRYAIKSLREKGLLREKRDWNDLRRKYYRVEKGGKICTYNNFNSRETRHRKLRERNVE